MRAIYISAAKPIHLLSRQHLIDWMRNPDPGSAFDRKMRFLQWLPDAVLLFLLVHVFDYGGLVWVDDKEQVVGHVMHQRHGHDLHIFSVWVEKPFRKHGVGAEMVRAELEHAREDRSIRRVRGGAGRNADMIRLWDRVVSNISFVRKEADGWVALSH